jgi:hypothetical protein
MAPVLKVFLEFLRVIRFARDYIKRSPRSAGSLFALLSRKLNVWWQFWLGKLGSLGRPKPAERSFLGTEASSHSSSGGLAVVRGYVVAASSVPASASHPSLHEHTERQPAVITQTVDDHSPVLTSPSIDHPHAPNPSHPRLVNRKSGSLRAASIRSHASDRLSIITDSRESLRAPLGQPSRFVHPPVLASLPVDHSHTTNPSPLGGRSSVDRRSGSLGALSIQSRASDRYSIITGSHESIRAPPDGPSRLPRATHRQFGRGPDPSWELPTRPHTLPRLEIITSKPFSSSPIHVGPVTPVVQSSASSSYVHEPLSPPIRRRRSSTSVVVDILNVSTESLPLTDLHDEPLPPPPGSPMSSDPVTLDYFIPGGRFVQLINSDQIPRYAKDATMQVGCTVLLLHPYMSLQTPRGDNL